LSQRVYGKMAIHRTFLDFRNFYIETLTSRIFAPVINFSFKDFRNSRIMALCQELK